MTETNQRISKGLYKPRPIDIFHHIYVPFLLLLFLTQVMISSID